MARRSRDHAGPWHRRRDVRLPILSAEHRPADFKKAEKRNEDRRRCRLPPTTHVRVASCASTRRKSWSDRMTHCDVPRPRPLTRQGSSRLNWPNPVTQGELAGHSVLLAGLSSQQCSEIFACATITNFARSGSGLLKIVAESFDLSSSFSPCCVWNDSAEDGCALLHTSVFPESRMHNERCTSGLEGGHQNPTAPMPHGADSRPYRGYFLTGAGF
jgi:hypothetical protein